jgi:hypothetical protein
MSFPRNLNHLLNQFEFLPYSSSGLLEHTNSYFLWTIAFLTTKNTVAPRLSQKIYTVLQASAKRPRGAL